MLFDLQQDLPTSSGQAAPVTLDMIAGTYSQSGSSSNISFTIPSTPLLNGSHTFSVSNPNSLALRFNWSASVDYNVIAERLSIKAAGTSVPPWNFTNLTAGAELDLTAAILDGTVAPTPGSATTMRTLTLVVNSTSAGAVELSALDIRYVMDITTPDLASDFDAALWATPFSYGRADVPVWVSSPGECTLEILETAITYDWPPQYDGIAVNRSDEDVELVTDLYTIFHDDYDPLNLAFRFDVVSGSSLAFVALRGYNLSITPYENLSGDVVVNITATDQGGLSNWSGPLTFTFTPVNDPPRLTTERINVTWGLVQTVDLSPYFIDAESPRSAVTIESATGAPVTVQGQSLVFNFSAGASDVDLLVTLSDGADTRAWPLLVHPRVSNSVPVLRSVEILNIPSNAAYLLDLGAYAYDEEDPLSALTFRVAMDATTTSGLYWAVERTASTTYLKLIPHSLGDVITSLTVTDTDGNSNTTQLSIHIGPPANTPPRIVAVDPSLSVGEAPVSIFLVTKGADLEDGDTPLNWTIENHNPQLFSASIDPSTLTLVVEAVPGAVGTGSLTLTARDSGGLTQTRTISVSVSRAAEGSSWSIVALGFFFAAVVLGSAISVYQSRKRPSPKGAPRHTAKGSATEGPVEVAVIDGAAGDEPVSLPELPAEVGQGSEDVGAFMRGETAAPSDTPPGDDDRVVTLGLKSDLEGAAAAVTPAISPLAPKRGPARMAELYLFSLKDGGLLYQVPPTGVPVLTQIDENEFLQWAYDTVRRTEKAPDAARVLEWREWKVVLARGVSFFIAGRATGEDYDALRKEVKTLVEEVDANFPGTPLDWQRTETLESVSDVLKRLVRGA